MRFDWTLGFYESVNLRFRGLSENREARRAALMIRVNRGVDNLDIVCHNQYLKVDKTVKIIIQSQNYSILSQKMPAAAVKS